MDRGRRAWARGFGAGVAAGAAATLVLFVYRIATGAPMPQEALAEWIAQVLPYPVFALILGTLQHLAKPLAFAVAVVVGLLAAGAGGVVYGLVLAGLTQHPAKVGAGREGTRAVARASRGALSGDARAVGAAMNRRVLLRRSALIVLVGGVASRLGTWSDAAGTRVTTPAADAAAGASGIFRGIRGMPPEVTPNGRFYQISKNYPFDPTVDTARWSLQITGLVARPLRFSLNDLRAAAPSVERYQTLECISNEVGGDLIGNARWKGIRVRDILAMAEVRPDARTIVWHTADGYFESVPLDVAMDAGSLLAYEMNGEPLPRQHGAPVRVLLLNRYGTKQPKWLTGIEAADTNFSGWQHRRFSQQAIVKTNSAFNVEVKDRGVVRLGGWAFAGRRGIAKVELSADGGATWFPAVVKAALAENCWQLWAAEWAPPGPGDYALKVRAVDRTGATQRGRWQRLPDGAEGYHEVRIRFRV
ncbi:MAG TPA: molybdopterin-dependent oxidoreductase [bacterium]|nr:molybdopterin-dependent oxidoreductase [bacterium]